MNSKRNITILLALVLPAAISPLAQTASADSGFSRAIESASAPVVKLYGLSAGIQAGYGSGILLTEDGLVLTVDSLLLDGRTVRAVTSDGGRYEAGIVDRNRRLQLALLQLRPEKHWSADGTLIEPEAADLPSLPHIDLAHETQIAPGDWVIVAGNAFKVADGAEPVSIAHGVISSRTRLDAKRRLRDFEYTGDVLVIDAITSNPGAPGSSVVTLKGEFIGMIGRNVSSNVTHTHFNYAIPRDVLHAYVHSVLNPAEAGDESLEAITKPGEPFDPGFKINRVGYRRVLPFVERVVRDSPASRAGLKKDDLIIAVNGKNIYSSEDFDKRRAALGPHDALELVIRRGREIATIRIEPEANK